MGHYDYYGVAKELSKKLKDENLGDLSSGITNAMEAGSTGTEIFMALRWNVNKILASNECSKGTKEYAKRLYDELDKALKP
jgi:hypothetical protein